MTKIPEEYWKKPPGEIGNLNMGEAAWIKSADLILGRGGVAYLRKDGKTYFSRDHVQADGNPHVLPVYRSDSDEFYVHLYEPERATTWYPNPDLAKNTELLKVEGLATKNSDGEDGWPLAGMRQQLDF